MMTSILNFACLSVRTLLVTISALTMFAASAGTLIAQQLTVRLNVSSRPDPYLSNWAQRKDVVIVTITNPGAQTNGRFDTQVSRDGVLQAHTKPASMPVLVIPPGVSQFFAEDIIPFSAVTFVGSGKETALRTGMLPAGEYELCTKILDAATLAPISTPVCKNFTLTSFQAPVLLLPEDGSMLARGNRPRFRWTGVSPKPTSQVSYHVRVFEVLQGQTPVNAYRVNRPILDVPGVRTLDLQWPPDVELPRQGMRYIWSVRALDENNNPLGEPDGYASPFVFSGCCEDISSTGKKSTTTDDGSPVNKSTGTTNESTTGKKSTGDETGSSTTKSGVTVDAGALGTGTVDATSKQAIQNTPWVDPNPPGLPCNQCSYGVAITDTAAGATPVNTGDSLSLGRFKLKVTSLTDSASAMVKGKGEIYIPWLLAKVMVTFDSLKVNAAKQVVKGQANAEIDATAPQYPQQWAINQATSWNWTKQSVKWVDDFIKQKGAIVKSVNNMNVPMKLPLGFNNVKGFTICISEMKFLTTDAVLASVATVPLAKLDDTLSFGLKQIPICPQGFGKSGRLEILQDIDVRGLTQNQPTFAIAAKAPTNSRQGCYITFGCDNNSDTLAMDIDVTFPRAWMTPRPDPDSTKQSIANLKGKTINWSEWMLVGNLTASTFANTNGLGLVIDTLAFDYSDLENPPGIVFPANYVGITDTTFNGFYAKRIKLWMPDGWRTFADTDAAPQFTAEKLIINKNGFTGTLVGSNIVQFPKANLNRLAASVDTVKVVLLNSNLTTAYMRGKITLPITDTTSANGILYKALFNGTQKTFDFSLTPTGTLDLKLFAGAKLTLLATSSLTMSIKKGAKKFYMVLNGDVGWNNADIQVGQKKINIDLSPDFENFSLGYDEAVSPNLSLSPGDWSYASAQKKLAKIPVTIDKIKFTQPAVQGAEALRVKLAFDLIISLDSNRIGGKGTFDIMGSVERNEPGSKHKFRPKFLDFNVSKVIVFAHLPAVSIDGELNFYNDDPLWGNGFSATIKAKFKELQLQLDAAAMFGSKVDNTNTRFRYWFVSAKAILPPPGIVFLPGYAFYGFGATAWRRVNVNMTGAKPDVNQVANATSKAANAVSGATMVPDKNIGFGFRALAVLGTSPDPSKMNADVAIMGQFSNSGGMTNIGFQGDIWLKAKLLERANAPVKGTLNITYDFTTRIFDLNATVTVNKPPVTGNGNLKVHLEGLTGIWYVKLGEPTNRNTLNVNFLGTSISANTYFMFGKNITPPTGFTQRTVNGLASAGCYGMTPSSAGTSAAISGNGFAGGLDVGFDSGERTRNIVGRVYAKWRFAGGFEFNASVLRYPNGSLCGYDGMNWWYVQANAAAYAIASAGVWISPKKISDGCIVCCTKNHPSGCTFNIAQIKFGAWAQAGFPNPSWVEGQASGSYDVLGGAFSGSFNAEFNVGTKCTPAPPAAATVAAQDVAEEQKNQLIKSVEPANNTTNFSHKDAVRVLYTFEPNVAFALPEQQGGSAGNTVNRTFQAKYTVAVEKNVSGVWTGLQIQSTKDALGAFLYRKKAPLQISNQNSNNNAMNDPPAPPKKGPPMSIGDAVIVTPTLGPTTTTTTMSQANVNTYSNPFENTPPATEADNFSFNNTAALAFLKNTANWDSSASFRVTVVGTLWELNTSNQWVVAKSKTSNQDIKQTIIRVFSTPLILIATKKNTTNNQQQN